jgi:hypothetical protein
MPDVRQNSVGEKVGAIARKQNAPVRKRRKEIPGPGPAEGQIQDKDEGIAGVWSAFFLLVSVPGATRGLGEKDLQAPAAELPQRYNFKGPPAPRAPAACP